MSYPNPKRGRCIILNNSDFHGWPNEERRNEPENDNTDLRLLFEKLNFLVDIHRNCKAHEIEALFEECSQMIHTYSCLFVIIMSHGRNRHEILSYDNQLISTKGIAAKFSDSRCPSLAGKPKVFLVQTCKGKYFPDNFKSPDNALCEVTLPGDTLIVHSMVEGTLPISNFHGTWYIREFIKAVEEYGEDEHLVDILTIVNSLISESAMGAPGFVQTPEMINCLSKKFYLKPQVSTVALQSLELANEPCYPINQYPRGYCIIINNLGSECEEDVKSLAELMKESLGFHVQQFVNLSTLATTTLLQHICRADGKEQCCLFVAIFANGNDECFKDADKKAISFDETVGIFNYITEKPKIFLFHLKEELTVPLLQRVSDRVPLIGRDSTRDNPTNSPKPASRLLQRVTDKVPFVRKNEATRDGTTTNNGSPMPVRVLQRVTDKVPFIRRDSASNDSASNDSATSSIARSIYCNRDDVFQAVFTHHPSHHPTYIPQLVKLVHQSADVAPFNEILRDACQYGGGGCATFLCPARELHLPLIDSQYGPSNIAFTAREFRMALNVWLSMRKETIVALSKKKEELIKLGRNIRISKIAGASASIVGGVTTVVGLALTPVTLGGSLLVAGVGAGVAAAGGATAVGATIADVAITKRTLKEAAEILNVDNQLCQALYSLYAQLQEQAEAIRNDDSNITPEDIIVAFLRGGESLLRLGAVAVTGGVVAAEIIGVGGVSAIEGGILAARIGGAALTGVAIFGGILAVVVMPINIYDLSTNAYRLSRGSPTRAVEAIEEQLKELEKQRREVEDTLGSLMKQSPP